MNIWVNGCFDILHTGHLELLRFAKFYTGDSNVFGSVHNTNRVIVGLDSDERIMRMKGAGRPINNIYDRIQFMASLRMVDDVVVFNTDDELKSSIRDNDIDFIVVGDHYRDKVVVGAEFARRGVVFYPTDERSTTRIIEKIKSL